MQAMRLPFDFVFLPAAMLLLDLLVVLVVRGDALQAADRDRLGLRLVFFLDAAAAARGLARTIAGAAEDSGEDVRLPVDHVGVGVTPGGDHADVFGNRRVGGTGPLAIDDFVEVVGVLDIGGLHESPSDLPADLLVFVVVSRVYSRPRRPGRRT